MVHASVANYHHKEYPEFEDWGDANLIADNGATNYIRIDWLNPDGLRTWGDGRTFILGTQGYIELRKYLNVAAISRAISFTSWITRASITSGATAKSATRSSASSFSIA